MNKPRLNDFDDIRPYTEEEIAPAMKRIAASSTFPLLSSYVYPERDVNEIRNMVSEIKTISGFQYEVMKAMNEQVIARSVNEFSYSGTENITPDKKYLFVSNHRDIVLDSALLQYVLYLNGHETSEITFGANLMSSDLIIDIGKSNKMFRVERGGNMKEFYLSSKHLSEYIRFALTEKNESVWIAQRNGRTKNGIDATDQGIIKMFSMSNPNDKIKSLAELNIVPIAVSYEWEPCDVLKALELYESRFTKYTKKPGEDLNSILTGIMQQKGNVHFTICPMITESDLLQFENETLSDYHRNVALLLDKRIICGYRLWPNNYIAHDLRYGQQRFTDKYTDEQKNKFIDCVNKLDRFENCEQDVLKDIFMGIYSNPVDSVLKLG